MKFLGMYILVFAVIFGMSGQPLHAAKVDLCAQKFITLSGYRTKGVEREVTIDGRKISYKEVALPSSTKKLPADQINWKSYDRDAFAELFFKMIRPSVTNEWKIQKFNISEILSSGNENELIMGLDVNHSYLLLRDGKTGKYIRADGGAHTEFFVRNDTDTVTSGIFIRFPAIPDADLKILRDSLSDGQNLRHARMPLVHHWQKLVSISVIKKKFPRRPQRP